MEFELFRDLGIALAAGFLVGLQREWAEKKVAGIRTFPLITLFGALCGVAADRSGGLWILAAGLLAVALMFWVGNRIKIEEGAADPGLTTEFAGLVMYLVGVLVMLGGAPIAVVTAGLTAVLLHWKIPLHRLAGRLGTDDFRAIIRLVIIAMIILPLLPNRAYGPYGVLNPFKIWLMVVLIVGISMAAYVAQRLLGRRVGTLLAGLLGGMISSTATTVSYARRSRRGESSAAALVILLASTVVFVRVLIEIAVVAPSLLPTVGPPLGAMMLLMTAICAVTLFAARASHGPPESEKPPSDLWAAVIFGILYAAVLFGVAAVKENFGEPAMYIVAGLSGLTDMDAITLSTAQLMKAQTIETEVGWRLILVGAIANLAFKAAAVAALGSRELRIRATLLLGLSMACGIALLFLWPS